MKKKSFLILFLCYAFIGMAQDFTDWTIGINFSPGFYWKYNKIEFNHPGIIAVKPEFPNTINFGVAVYRNFNEKWSFKTGIEYSKNTQKFISSNLATQITGTNEYFDYHFNQFAYGNIYYVTMPIQIKYYIKKTNNISLFTEQGARVSYLIDYYQKLVSYKIEIGQPGYTNEIDYTTTSYYNGNNIRGRTGYNDKRESAYTQLVFGYTANIGVEKKTE